MSAAVNVSFQWIYLTLIAYLMALYAEKYCFLNSFYLPPRKQKRSISVF